MPAKTRPNLSLPEVKGSKERFVPPPQPDAKVRKQKTIQLSNFRGLSKFAKATPVFKASLPPSLDHALPDMSAFRTKVEFKRDGQRVRLEPLVVKIPTDNLYPDKGPICTVHGTHYTNGMDEVIKLDLELSSGFDAAFTSVLVVVGIYKDNVPIPIKDWIPKLETDHADVNWTWGTHVNVGATLSTNAALQGNFGMDRQLQVNYLEQSEVEVEGIAAQNHQIRWLARPRVWKTAALKRLVCGLTVEVPLPLIAKVHLAYTYQVTSGFRSWSWRQKEKIIQVPPAELSLEDIELELCQCNPPPPAWS